MKYISFYLSMSKDKKVLVMGFTQFPETRNMYSSTTKKYGDTMEVCKRKIESSEADIIRCVEHACDQSNDTTMVIADLCTADGKNSVDLFSKIKEILGKRGKDVLLLMEDQLNNDFNTLLKNVNDNLRNGKMFLAVSGTDMYVQCFPSDFVHVEFCGFGTHWLKKRDTSNIKNGLFVHDGTEEEQAIISKHAACDWENFLTCRGNELKKGGYIYIIALVKNADNTYGSFEFHKQLTIAQDEMYREGLLTEEEYTSMYLNTYHRTEEEIRHPFDNNLLQPGITLQSYTVTEIVAEKHPGKSSQQNEKEEWALRLQDIAKAWTYNTIGLKCKSEEERKEKLEQFYGKFKMNLLTCKFDLAYTVADIVISKR